MPNPAQKAPLVCLLALLPLIGHAQICKTSSIPATTPDTQFSHNNNGTVTDTRIGLMWKRCSEGQAWNGTTCTGAAALYTWREALQQAQKLNSRGFATFTDWRVPNIKELRSIVELQCFDPSINLTVFPAMPPPAYWSSHTATPSVIFWSSSSTVASDGSSSNAGGVDFYDGDDGNWVDKFNSNHVRLVRSGQ
jgi:hypothetical protein